MLGFCIGIIDMLSNVIGIYFQYLVAKLLVRFMYKYFVCNFCFVVNDKFGCHCKYIFVFSHTVLQWFS